MKGLVYILLAILTLSGCALAGRNLDQYPVASPGWRLGSEIHFRNGKERTAEFSCGSYTCKLVGGIPVRSYYFGGPLIFPIIPQSLVGDPTPDTGKRDVDLVMKGDHIDKVACPFLRLDDKVYKTKADAYRGEKACFYSIPTPKGKLVFLLEDQMGCKVSPLEFKLTSTWRYEVMQNFMGY